MLFFARINLTTPLKQAKKKNEKIASRENLTTKKMSTRFNLYYDGFSSYDFKKKIHLKTP